MAQRDITTFKSTKNSRFADNSSGSISEGDSRDMFEDTADSFLNITDHLLDEDDMASNSASKVPSQQSVKTYVDAATGGGAVASGTYTPTLTNVTNVTASTAYLCQYIRIGSVVTVSGRIDVDNNLAATDSEVGISLPVASNFANDFECAGVANSGVTVTGYINGDITNNRASLNLTPPGTANKNYYFTFTYLIV